MFAISLDIDCLERHGGTVVLTCAASSAVSVGDDGIQFASVAVHLDTALRAVFSACAAVVLIVGNTVFHNPHGVSRLHLSFLSRRQWLERPRRASVIAACAVRRAPSCAVGEGGL